MFLQLPCCYKSLEHSEEQICIYKYVEYGKLVEYINVY